jgi:hypothetical protein
MRHDARVSEPVPMSARVELPRSALPARRHLLPASVAVLAVAGAALLVAGEFSTLFRVQAISVVVKTVKTGPHHSYAQLLIVVAALAMAWGHLRTGRRPPLLALAALGAIALLIGIVGDLPDTHAAGVIGDRFEAAKATPRAGLWLELSGGACLILAALVGLLLAPRRPAAPLRQGRAA